MLSILICFYFIKQKKSFWLFILIIIFFYTLLLTGSRASMVGMIAGGALFIDHSYLERGIGRAALRVVIVGTIILIGIYVMLSPETIKYLFSLMGREDRKSTRLNSSHVAISYAVFCWKKKINLVSKRPCHR